MISITEKIYSDLAQRLIEQLHNVDFYNGTIELDYPELYTTFHCTLLVYQDKINLDNHIYNTISEILPVWWEFETACEYGIEYNDFSWATLYEYIIDHLV